MAAQAKRDMLGRFLVESRWQKYPRISKADRLCILVVCVAASLDIICMLCIESFVGTETHLQRVYMR